jgi:inhibitor of KinA
MVVSVVNFPGDYTPAKLGQATEKALKTRPPILYDAGRMTDFTDSGAIAPRIMPASDGSLLVRFGDGISPEHHRLVRRLTGWLLDHPRPFVRNIHPAYCTVLVSFDPVRTSAAEVEAHIRGGLDALRDQPDPPARTVEVPVCYGGAHGPDLPDVAAHCGLPAEEVVRIHSAGDYRVYFLGFSPGFPYLGGLDPRLATPRLPAPRRSVPAGSVAIGGAQTGVYPVRSPGGWRLIGRTPAPLFDPARTPPALLQMGDLVRFVPIGPDEFEKLSLKGI